MGGYGSGRRRYGARTVAEDCRHIEAVRWQREGILGPWAALPAGSRWCWLAPDTRQERAGIGREVAATGDRGTARLNCAVTVRGEKVPVYYAVNPTITRTPWGSPRWWVPCPPSVNGAAHGRRCGKLYLPPGDRYFGCRRCDGLTFTSRDESRTYDPLYGHLAEDLDWDPKDVTRVMARFGKRGSV